MASRAYTSTRPRPPTCTAVGGAGSGWCLSARAKVTCRSQSERKRERPCARARERCIGGFYRAQIKSVSDNKAIESEERQRCLKVVSRLHFGEMKNVVSIAAHDPCTCYTNAPPPPPPPRAQTMLTSSTQEHMHTLCTVSTNILLFISYATMRLLVNGEILS